MGGLVNLQNIYAPSVTTRSSSVKISDSGLSFSEYLNSFVDGTEEIIIPDKWHTNQQINAIDIAVAYMRDTLGVDVDSRLPAYEITKDKQSYANHDHYIFDYDLDVSVDNDAMAERIIDNLVAAGLLKSEEDDEEEEYEAVDELLKAIKAQQKTLKEEMIDIKKSGFTVEEIKEILAGLHFINSMTVK